MLDLPHKKTTTYCMGFNNCFITINSSINSGISSSISSGSDSSSNTGRIQK